MSERDMNGIDLDNMLYDITRDRVPARLTDEESVQRLISHVRILVQHVRTLREDHYRWTRVVAIELVAAQKRARHVCDEYGGCGACELDSLQEFLDGADIAAENAR